VERNGLPQIYSLSEEFSGDFIQSYPQGKVDLFLTFQLEEVFSTEMKKVETGRTNSD